MGIAHTDEALQVVPNGDLWIGTHGGGISRYDSNQFTTFSAADGLVHNGILCGMADRNGDLWYGSRSGLSRYEGQRICNLTARQGLSGD